MKPKPNSKHKTFNIDEDAIKNLSEGSKLNNMNQSEFIEFLVNSWETSIDPSKKIKHIQSEKKLLKEKIILLEKEEEKIIEILQKKDEWNKKRQTIKPQIIRNLMRIISERRYSDAEIIAKNQSIALGIPAISLLTEATNKIDTGQ